jgi:hypothetical protein
MASEKAILGALDLVTTGPQAELEALGAGGDTQVRGLRSIIASPNIVGVGIGEKRVAGQNTGTLALMFYCVKKISKRQLRGDYLVPPALPEVVGGPEAIPTDVVAIGHVVPEAGPFLRRTPIKPGFSIGHIDISAGTLGAIVKKNGQLFLLSNSHVLAKSGKAEKGDAIVFPGPDDTGHEPEDLIGRLEEFIPFTLGTDFVNRVDCALAKPLEARMADLRSEIRLLGLPKGTLKPKRGMKVTKAGRTTGKTTGTIRDVNFRFVLHYPNVGEVGFLDQVLCTRYTRAGDSGSLVLDSKSGKAVGLHFAGADGGSVFNPIQDVLEALGAKLVTTSLPKK